MARPRCIPYGFSGSTLKTDPALGLLSKLDLLGWAGLLHLRAWPAFLLGPVFSPLPWALVKRGPCRPADVYRARAAARSRH